MVIPIQYGYTLPRRRSFGATGAQIATQSVQTGGAILTAAAPSIWGSAAAASAVPIIGAGIAAVTIAIGLFTSRKGPAQKIATTRVAEYYEPLFQQNLQAYIDGPHTRSSQIRALANYDALWADLVGNCRTPENGEPGQRCVDDRKEGACKWRDDAGQCWNWFIGYRDPIANDPNVRPDPTTSEQFSDAADSVLTSLFPAATSAQRSRYAALAIGALVLGVLGIALGGSK